MSSCNSGCDTTNMENIMCPTKMSDGRAFTDYRPRCTENAEVYHKVLANKMVGSSYEARLFLQHNADQLMDDARNRAIQTLIPCAPCNRSFQDAGTMLGERYVVRCNGVTCTREEINPQGLGDGRSY